MANGISGKTAIVTGASRGIGAATCRMLAREGAAKIVVHYHSYREGAEALGKELSGMGAAVELIGADLGAQEGIAGFILQLHEKAAGAQILINNAGHLVKRAKLAGRTAIGASHAHTVAHACRFAVSGVWGVDQPLIISPPFGWRTWPVR